MTMVTLGISSVEDAKTRMLAAFQGEAQGEFIGFATAELLWKVITPKRWAVLRAMTGAGPIAIREVARRVGRDEIRSWRYSSARQGRRSRSH